jgi:hypothetical protein
LNSEVGLEETVLEIIELPNGEIALKRIDDDSSPLVKIRFSKESEVLLDNMKMLVARAMIEAGMDAYAELNAIALDDDAVVLH